MPRTKAVRTKKKTLEAAIDPECINTMLAIKRELIDKLKEKLKKDLCAHDNLLSDINLQFESIKNMINHNIANKTFAELKASKSKTMDSISYNLTMESVLDLTKATKKGPVKHRSKRSLSCTEDEAESIGSKTNTRASRSRSKVNTVQKSSRVSRSLSRSKMQQQPPVSSSFKTPSKKVILPAYGTITPKVNPNIPQVILRRPKQGEVAVSLQGSPLMVNSVVSDQQANVNIPLPDGRLLSLQPQRGLRMSQIPTLDADTQQQIQALRDNLNKVCAMVFKK